MSAAVDILDPRQLEIAWYRENGKYPERITKDSEGALYVIGDFSWNHANMGKPEFIEFKMKYGSVKGE